ncbi:hypothetical protein D3C71_1474410 [compost metagenome]
MHPQFLGVLHIQRVFGIHKRAGTAQLLHLGNHLQRERGLARRFRAIDLDHTATGQAAHAQRDIEAQRAGGDNLDVLDHLTFTQAHDRALAKLLLDLGERSGQGLGLFGVHGQCGVGAFDCDVHEKLLEKQQVGCLHRSAVNHRLDA